MASVQGRRKWFEVSFSRFLFSKAIFLYSNLARLVPSTEFEQKRRQINKHLLEEIEKDEEPVLCGKKKKKKKKKKKNKDDEPEEVIMVSLLEILLVLLFHGLFVL